MEHGESRDIAMARSNSTATSSENGDVAVNNPTSSAFTLAQSTVANKDFNATCDALIEAGEETKRGPLTMLWALQDAGIDMQAMALPGSKTGDATNRPVEAYTKSVTDATTGEKKNVKGNFFTDFTAGTKDGQLWLERIADIKLAQSAENFGKSKYYKDKHTDAIYLTNEKNKYTQRLSALRNLIRNAVRIADKQGEIETRLADKVGWMVSTYTVEGVEKLTNTPKPFIIFDAKKPMLFKALAVGQFLKLNVGKALESGGTFDALCATLENKEPGTTESKAVAIETVDTFHDYVDAVSTYVDHVKEAAILTELMKSSQDDLVLSIGALYYKLDSIFSKVEKRYARLVADKVDDKAA